MTTSFPGHDRSTRWLSRDFSELLAEPELLAQRWDVVIVGSGYGAAMAAAELAGATVRDRAISVLILERGREYLPGSFPSRMADLPTQVRGRAGPLSREGEGLFDIRLGADLGVVCANGLGGGSLINAGVMEIPNPSVFKSPRWPLALQKPGALQACFDESLQRLGAATDSSVAQLSKNQTLRTLARGSGPAAYRDAKITVALDSKITSGGVRLEACKRCGDCATGCNHGAKESLDTNLLALARQRGARVYCGATVLDLQRDDGGWALRTVHTAPTLRQRESAAARIQAHRVILAAGALGSTEILMRSQKAPQGPVFSNQLGRHFSGNGDLLAYGYAHEKRVNAFADEDQPPADREVGPTITGIVDTHAVAKDGSAIPVTIEEMAVPGPLKRLVEEMVTTAATIHRLGERDSDRHVAGHAPHDPFAIQPGLLQRTSIFAAMGDDGAGGVLRLSPQDRGECDGQLSVEWPAVRHLDLFKHQTGRIAQLMQTSGLGGRFIPNPLWQPLPDSLANVLGGDKGPPLTVHPLGGCGMADSADSGVVDEYGRVFNPLESRTRTHEGLVVLDSAIIPRALGTNPALTITALTLRAVRHLRDQVWGWSAAGLEAPAEPLTRPTLAQEERVVVREPAGTQAQFTERLSGRITLSDERGQPQECWSEITLTYEPLVLGDLLRGNAQGALHLAELRVGKAGPRRPSLWRLYPLQEWQHLRTRYERGEIREDELERHALTHEITGTLTLMRREPSCQTQRIVRALWAWLRNRGVRDIWEKVSTARLGGPTNIKALPGQMAAALSLASHAGQVRLFEYDLQLGPRWLPGQPSYSGPAFKLPLGSRLAGKKRIAYTRPGNPWRQLMEMTITEAPAWKPAAAATVWALDTRYFVREAAPLLRLISQRDQMEALADTGSLLLYFARLMLSIHLWSARKPDAPPPRVIQRLPGNLPGLAPPDIHFVEVDHLDGQPVHIRLTRYRHPQTLRLDQPPVVMLHGYTASGTTFAHPALQPSLAGYLALEQGRDVWVVDLRSSCGLPSATQPWTFDRIALQDIPAAIAEVRARSGHAQVDVVAHCIGAAMFGMAVLSARRETAELVSHRDEGMPDRFRAARQQLPNAIRRVVFSQLGPVMEFSEQNILRSFLLGAVERMIGPIPLQLRTESGENAGFGALDRLLSTLPYPDDELLLENPVWPWQQTTDLATRHRLDALFGRTYSLRNLPPQVRQHIDDFFGPLNLATLSQVIHFARLNSVSNRAGVNHFVSQESLLECWRFPVLALHADENGVTGAGNANRLSSVLQQAGIRVETEVVRQRGHQDSLIGHDPSWAFSKIETFLSKNIPARSEPAEAACTVHEPWLGPVLMRHGAGTFIGMGADPALGRPSHTLFMPVFQSTEEDRIWQLDLNRMREAGLGSCVRALPADTDVRYFSLALPGWCLSPMRGVVAVWLLYAQADEFQAVGGRIQPDLWHLGPTLLSAVKPVAASILPIAFAATEAAQTALDALNQRHQRAGLSQDHTRLPPGFLALNRLENPSGTVCIALGSCQYPAGILDEVPAYDSWKRLDERCRKADGQAIPHPDLVLLTGDQIYADATAALLHPALADDRFRYPHERWLNAQAVRRVLRRVPMATLPDDHEIHDGWEPIAGGPGNAAWEANQTERNEGLKRFIQYQHPVTPPTSAEGPQLWQTLDLQGLPLFMLDTRTRRKHRNSAGVASASLLGPEQWSALKTWLLDPQHRNLPKLIACPSLPLPRHRDAIGAPARADGWDGYPASLTRLLRLIADERIHGVIFLSGDEHLGLRATLNLRNGNGLPPIEVHSIHAPGLYRPFRFANGQPSDFLLNETWRVPGPGGGLECTISTRVVHKAGFGLITLRRKDAGLWELQCEFDGVSVPLVWDIQTGS